MKLDKILVVYTNPTTNEYRLTLGKVKKVLKKYRAKYNLANRDKLKDIQFENHDLVIAVGGDGTFLRAAQFVKNQLILGVNADVKNKEGFFMQSDKKNFEARLRKIIKNKFHKTFAN